MRVGLRAAAWGIGIGGAALMILADEGRVSHSAALLGASVVWAGSIFLPLIFFNRDLYKSSTAQLLIGLLLVVQGVVMFVSLPVLIHIPFLYWFPLCAIQVMLYEVPFVWLRNRIEIRCPK